MNKLFNLTSTFKAAEADDGSVMIRGMASTADFDRAGDSISAEAWTKGGLANFEKNPIILFNHDYDKPIGRATGLKAGPNGLELECKISKAAPANVAQLVKDGVLGAFSVGFRVKDADYLKETDGLMIKDAELFEVSVVSVPCNQSATFSLAKSFDSDEEYNEFKKTFTNRVDLAGQSLAKDEDTSSNIASDHTPKSADDISADQEIKMDNKDIDLEAFAKQVAEDTAAKIAMKQAEQKAAEEAQAKAAQEADEAKALEAESIKSVVNSGVETGVEKLMADVEAKMSEKDANLQEVMNTFRSELEEKQAEIKAMQESKKSFAGRSGTGDLSAFGKDFLQAKVLGAVTGKGYNTDFGRSVMEKAGSNADADALTAGIDQIVSTTFVDEVSFKTQIAGLFDELAVSSGTTILPVTREPAGAEWNPGNSDGTELQVGSTGSYNIDHTTVVAERLLAGTYVLNNTDEQLVVSLLPQLTKQLAKAHAIAVDKAILFGSSTSGNSGLLNTGGTLTAQADGANAGYGAISATPADIALTDYADPADLAKLRSNMGRYGQDTSELAIIVNPDTYYSMIHTQGFTDISEIGSDLATKLTGEVGSIFGIKVIVSDQMPARAANEAAGLLVNTGNFVRARLGGVNFETEYSVVNQRTNLVATQSVGFDQLIGDAQSCSVLQYAAS